MGILVPFGTVPRGEHEGDVPTRPGVLRRAAAGAWHAAAGFGFLLRHPSLWTLALLPGVLASFLLACGLFAGIYAIPQFEAAILPDRQGLSDWLELPLLLSLWGGVALAGLITGLAIALVVSAPLLERLSWRVEEGVQGSPELAQPPRWKLVGSLTGTLYLAVLMPGVLLLGVVPLLGPALGGLLGAHALVFQLAEGPLARRGLDLSARRAWHRRWRAESLGFGLAGVAALLAPGVNILLAPTLAPALAAGAALMVSELELSAGKESDGPSDPPRHDEDVGESEDDTTMA